jgi:hypothetical protein
MDWLGGSEGDKKKEKRKSYAEFAEKRRGRGEGEPKTHTPVWRFGFARASVWGTCGDHVENANGRLVATIPRLRGRRAKLRREGKGRPLRSG